ncbi:MAG: hypothetical protein IJJ15_01350 [Ruminococcus sp.]|nr:hypothetical protein [Ruminococcus sp.]
MISKIKKPVSILLSLIMVFSVFAIVPLSASAAVGDFVPESDYLTFTAEEDGSTVTLNVSAGSNLQYDLNGAGLTDYSPGTEITLANVGDYVRFRGTGTTFSSSKHVSITGKVACSGSVMSLRLDDNGRVQGLSDSCFSNMFRNCTGLTTAPELPETMLAETCYYNMFNGCENLTTAPELPATTLARYCYRNMFSNCGSLTTAPELPATTLENGCYSGMFIRCGRLTTAPELPATTLADSCYDSMFDSCTSLTELPALPAEELANYCYCYMFYGCSSIKLSETQTAEYSIPYSVPSGGNGTTASYALDSMFAGTGGTFTGTPAINKTYYRPPVKYTVTWLNDDGTTIDTTSVYEGDAPTHADPTKAEDANYTYTFAGWTPEVVAATADATYTATFTATAKPKPWTYEITTGGEYTCPSTLSRNTIVSGGTEENPVIINITGQTTAQACIYLRSGYLKIVGNNNTVEANRGFVHFTGSGSYKPNGDAHLTITDLSLSSTSASNQYIQILSYANFQCQSTFENVTFKNCNINGSGAVVIGSETTHTFKNCTFEDITGYNAGGISVRYGSDVTMEGCTFKNCTRTRPYSTSFLGGGAVWVEEDTKLTLDGCTFENCTGECGAIGIENTATLTLKGNTTITGNQDGNLYLPTGATFNVAEDFTGTVGVTTQTAPTDSASVTLSSDLADTQAALANKNIVSDNANYAVSYDSNKLFLVVPATYTVTWKNGDDVLETDTDVAEGTTPTYDGTTPTKNPDGKYVYTFSGWSPEVTAVTGDVTYTAQFDKMIYSIYINEGDVIDAGETIRFMALKQGNNWRAFELHIYFDGELVKEVFSEDGSTTEPDRYYTTTQKCIVDSYNVEGPYHPIYLKSLHTVTWKNGDDVLETDNDVAFGTTPTYDGATPYKADGADCIYTFSGWTPEVSAVTGDATYTATFTESEKPETIKDCNNKYGDFRLYSNVPIVSFSNVDDLLTGAIIPITYGDSNTMIPVQDAKGYSYKFYDQTGTEIPAQIASSSSAPGSNYELSDDVTVYTNVINFTRPAGCTAIYIVATEPAVDLFPQHSITLGGNIGVNFYIDSAAADFANASTAVVKFTWDGGGEDRTKEVDLTKLTPNGDGYYKATVDVVAAQMAHKIHAEVYLNGEKLEQTDDYSVQDYAETVFANPEEYDSEKPEQLKALAQALLNYGAMAQTVFDSSLKEHPALANKTVGNNGYADVTADMIAAAINGEASDLNEVATQLGAKYYTNSLIYLSKNTLRIYFTPTSYPGEIPNAGAYDGNLSGYYYYVDHEDIPAAELDNQQTFNVNGTEFTFSALDYAKAVVESTKMEPDQQNLAKALYLYNMTANDYFDAAPAPVENVVDLSTLTAAYEAQDGDVLINALSGDYQITIAAGATVTLRDATITCLTTDAAFAGITPLGDATILLEGTNTVKGGHRRMPGIYIPANKTLTIDGTGSLVAYSGGDFSATSFSDSPASCGIGGKRNVSSGGAVAGGNLVINGGTITAYGGNGCAGIGSCASNGVISTKMFGDITINGGTVTASGLDKAAGIGSGKGTPCGNITITGGTVTATGDGQAAGIGSGYLGDCGDITIAGTVTSVTATKGSNATNSIGAGYSGTCGTVTIEDGANVIQN